MRKLCLLLIFACVACGPDPQATFQTGEVLLREDFEDAFTWDSRAQEGVRIGPRSGAYRMQADVNTYVRGFERSTTYDDVVIEVQTSQTSREDTNAYGIICRGTTDNRRADGYYFLIGGNGSYSIRRGQQDEVFGMVKWARTDAVNQGVAVNTIRVVCVDDYLALYVNGEFVDDLFDDTYSSGYIGFAAATREETTIEVSFDNLIVLEGQLED